MTEDEIAPPRAVVGIGASAGGLAALTSFFSAVSDDTDLAFVVVTHQPDESESYLRELLNLKVGIPVVDVGEEKPLCGGVVYVQVGAHEVSLRDQKIGRANGGGAKLALIDRFFRTLANTAGREAVCIVLSGGGSDGTVGAAEVKAKGGFVMAQDPVEAVQPGMPSSVIDAGIADCYAPAAELPRLLQEYVNGRLLSGEGGELDDEVFEEKLLSELFDCVVEQTGTDFSEYKEATIRRRTARRMNVLGIGALEDFVELLRDDPAEVEKLFHEFLIGVTNFFRDPETWEVLEKEALIGLIEGKSDMDMVRAWVPACSTGEEAYSLAILLTEIADELGRELDLQVFATDVDDLAIERARRGVYPAGIVVDVGEERLERFFVHENSHYRVCGAIRERVVFAPQDVLVDPPFTSIDVLSCRNFFIYLNEEPRRRLIPRFHYALAEDGILFLGPSESIDGDELFEAVNEKARVFRRRPGARDSSLVEFAGAASRRLRQGRGRAQPRFTDPRPPNSGGDPERTLLTEVAPPSLLCASDGTVIHIHGRTGRFLEPSPGSQRAVNIVDMAREGLDFELAGVLREARARRPAPIERRTVPVKFDGEWVFVDVRARCLERPPDAAGQITISLVQSPIGRSGRAEDEVDARRIAELEERVKEISGKRQDAVEDLRVANEELRSINEELQSTNEALKGVNTELQQSVELLSQANADMKNLLDGTDIATFFLDDELKIKRYTNRATELVNLIPSDVGRSISDLAMTVDVESLTEVARDVLETLRVRQLELESSDGRWYLARVLPYQTGKNVIEGIVITLTDITELKTARQAHERIVRNLARSSVAVSIQDCDLKYVSVIGEPFGRRSDELVGQSDDAVFGPEVAARISSIKKTSLRERARNRQWVDLDDGAISLVDVAPDVSEDGVVEGLVTVSLTLSASLPDGLIEKGRNANDDQ